MATFAVTFRNRQVGREYKAIMDGHAARHRRALAAASQGALDEMLRRGREDIASAGNFGSRWTKGLRGRVTQGRDKIGIAVDHDVPYFNVHQEGATIRGRPLLWIPLSFANVPKGTMARDYPRPLVRVDRKSGGAPLLIDTVQKEPKYFGIAQVRIPKRFHVVEIIREVARSIPQRFAVAVRGKI